MPPAEIARVRAITTEYSLTLVNSIITVSRVSASYLRGYPHMAKRTQLYVKYSPEDFSQARQVLDIC